MLQVYCVAHICHVNEHNVPSETCERILYFRCTLIIVQLQASYFGMLDQTSFHITAGYFCGESSEVYHTMLQLLLLSQDVEANNIKRPARLANLGKQ